MALRTDRPGWERWLDAVLGFLYPPVCQFCGVERATAAEGFVCPHCWSRPGAIRFIRPPFCARCGLPYEGEINASFECSNCREMDLHFSHARAAVVATPFLLEVIHRYKYQRALWFEPFLTDLLVRQAAGELRAGGWNLIVPVPLHRFKRREREFNQAERLAAQLGRASGIPTQTRAIERCALTRTQTQLNRAQRARNVHGAFQPVRGADLRGQRIVVVDDVLTTGATTSACARVLRAQGASDVCVWTVARGV